MVSKLRLIARIVKVAVIVVLVVYASVYVGVKAKLEARCVSMTWAHAVLTYDFKQYCLTIYQGDEVMAPPAAIEKLIEMQQQPLPPGF